MSSGIGEVKVNAFVCDVTPGVAAEWLGGRNAQNRSPDPAVVQRYAELMAGGRWRLCDQAIKFTLDGRLLDGQHRLMAVVASGQTVPMLVVEGLVHWAIWHPGGANHLNSEWCYTCDLERELVALRGKLTENQAADR